MAFQAMVMPFTTSKLVIILLSSWNQTWCNLLFPHLWQASIDVLVIVKSWRSLDNCIKLLWQVSADLMVNPARKLGHMLCKLINLNHYCFSFLCNLQINNFAWLWIPDKTVNIFNIKFKFKPSSYSSSSTFKPFI